MNKRKICIVTGTRAEYGLLYWLMKEIQADDELELQLIATGAHLSPEFGLTFKQIEEDGFTIGEKVEMLLSSDTPTGVVKSMGLATIGFADALVRLKPDLLVILGDRFEMLAVSQVALITGIPIAHLHGGELTLGAYDDSIRHSITKMATWHFTSTDKHKKRVIQLGESPKRVWNVGALGIENIFKIPLLSKDELYTQLCLDKNKSLLLITYHPETHGDLEGIHPLLKVLSEYPNMNLIFTKANADNGGRFINEVIEKYTSQNENAFLFDSLGQLRYLSAVKHAELVIGNSSSGLIEVPYLQTPTVNCGNRQAGREGPTSVFDAELDEESIRNGIEKALQYVGPYEQIFGDGNVSRKIVDILKRIPSYLIQKEFYDL
ncbi:UDP-N-acetylglucosamine 2-epimerase (hydrolyzing) [Paenibacillus sp. SYP-B3998]|uniref:UDP-N-acetylglucosamine 2-epimerase (Hydrolyzing) n=1 Tax=Paenibacillus sp. SYP-B3998 TaxID=2678564 RepID=A0A6G4A378_9BACL|nr:UDP-N-acetylglucosamine 2-epimerase [Paenibacillus sp. SYP-B3998]NEW08845.1 UDP-N-acetylglucosamine 2-epimerase (hydrolyzing) [Paenibacillus sp. SYP-B3998]